MKSQTSYIGLLIKINIINNQYVTVIFLLKMNSETLVIKAMDLFVSHPETGVARDDIREGNRYFPINEHDVYYKITTTRIVIIRILHESMKPELHFKSKPSKN